MVGLLQALCAAHPGDVVLVERRGQVGDALVAEVDEVLGHELRRAEVVHVHGVDAAVRDAVAEATMGTRRLSSRTLAVCVGVMAKMMPATREKSSVSSRWLSVRGFQ